MTGSRPQSTAIEKGAPSPRTEVVHHPRAIRIGDWKYIAADAEYYGWKAKEAMLFNIKKDPYEQNNLAAAEPERVKAMEARLQVLAAQWKANPRPPETGIIPKEERILFGEEESKNKPDWLMPFLAKIGKPQEKKHGRPARTTE